MEILRRRWPLGVLALIVAMALILGSDQAADIDRTTEIVTLPRDLHWSGSPTTGGQQVVLFGDPEKPGLYIQLTKWHQGGMSHPHFHPNDRYITVISGTWYKGTGTKYDPGSTVPIPARQLRDRQGQGHSLRRLQGRRRGSLRSSAWGPQPNIPAEVPPAALL